MYKLKIAILYIFVTVVFGVYIPLGPGPVVGIGIRDEEAREMLNTALTKLAAKDGPSYTIGEIVSAYELTFYENLYEIKATLLDSNSESKTCTIKIDKNHRQQDCDEVVTKVVFECPGEEQVVKTCSD